MNKLLLAALIWVFTFSSCKNTRDLKGSPLEKINLRELVTRVSSRELSYQTLSAKAKVKITENNKEQSATAQIRVEKDSLIWMSFRWLGIEGARMLVSEDSVKLIDRINKVYYTESFSYFSREYNVNIDFQTLQSLITGQLPLHDKKNMNLGLENDHYKLTGNDRGVSQSFLIEPGTYHLTGIELAEKKYNRLLTVMMWEFKELERSSFSMERSIFVKADETISVDLVFSRVKINETLSFPFSVNDKYDQAD